MSISFTQAKEALATNTYTVNALIDLVKSVSGTVEGATSGSTYLLYSGKMLDETTYASKVADAIQTANGGFHVVDSDVGRFLKSSEFNTALMRAIKLEVLGDAYATPSSQAQFNELNQRLNFVLNGKDGIGLEAPRISSADSLWDIASKNYTAAADGNFRIIAPQKLDDLSVFVQSELPALLENQKVTTIDGISRADLVALRA